VLQGSTSTVKMTPNNAKFHAVLTRFLNGAFAPNGTDQVFEEHDCRFLSGATFSTAGATQFRHRKWDANGLTFDRSELTASALTTGRTPIVGKALSGQTADLFQTQDDLGTAQLGLIAQGGGVRFYGTMSSASAPNNSIFRDSADNNVKVKDNSGVVAALSTAAQSTVTINTQAGTSYTLVAGDAGALVRCTAGSGVTLTVPPNSSVAFGVGTVIEVRQSGAGQVTVSPGSGVTLNSESSMRKTAAQHRSVSLVKVATDTWDLDGSLAA
jgi:hypothetical protein